MGVLKSIGKAIGVGGSSKRAKKTTTADIDKRIAKLGARDKAGKAKDEVADLKEKAAKASMHAKLEPTNANKVKALQAKKAYIAGRDEYNAIRKAAK